MPCVVGSEMCIRDRDDSAPRRLATQAYVSILGNLGIALASLSAINDD